MFEGWDEFYLLIGSAAAVLIGLIFVVISLMQDRSRSSVITGSKLYVGPIVLGVSFVLVLSAAALMPGMTARGFPAIAGLVALWGLARALMSIRGIGRLKDEVHWTDLWYYGVFPSLIYLALGFLARLVVGQGRDRRGRHARPAARHPQRVGPDHLDRAAIRSRSRLRAPRSGRLSQLLTLPDGLVDVRSTPWASRSAT